MLTHQIKVMLSREVYGLVIQMAHRDSCSTAAVVRRITLAWVRRWKQVESARHAHIERFGTDLESHGFDVALKVLFSERDLTDIALIAECESVSIARCIRRIVERYIDRLGVKPTTRARE